MPPRTSAPARAVRVPGSRSARAAKNEIVFLPGSPASVRAKNACGASRSSSGGLGSSVRSGLATRTARVRARVCRERASFFGRVHVLPRHPALRTHGSALLVVPVFRARRRDRVRAQRSGRSCARARGQPASSAGRA
nr:MAG: MC164L-like protein [Molluscum contagiosum virus]